MRYRFIAGFAESADGAVWIGAPAGLARFRDGKYTTYEKAEGYPGGRLTAIAADGDSAYAALPEGVLRIGDHPVRKWTMAEGLGSGFITALRWTARGLLAGSETGEIFRLEGNRFVSLLKLPSQNTIMSMIEGRSGTLWIGTVGGGIFRYAGGKLSQLSERDGLTTDSINEIAHDREGNLWVATTGGGLMRLKEGKVSTLVPPQPLHGEWILPLLQARDGSIWFATNGGGLNRLKDNNLVRMTTADGLQMNLISALAEDRAGAIWVGSDSGLQRIEGGRVVQTYGKADGFEATRVFALTAARDGSVWVSTNTGLYHFVNRRPRKLTEKDGIKPGSVLSIREASDGSLWLAKPGGVEHLVDGKLTSFSRADGLITKKITSLTIDEKDGSIWIATAGDGLGRIRNGKVTFYRESHGLLTDSVYGVIHDREGNLWIPTSLGLFTIKRPDLEQFDSGRIKTIPIQVFRKSDGLKSSDFTGGMDRPGFRAFDGKLWFPTTRGMAIVDPENMRTDRTPPQLIIESITANGIAHPGAAARIDLPAGNRQIEIAYTAPSYYSPESTTFRYKLEGFDPEWRDAGTRRTAYYTNVPPGTYRFLVQATTADAATAMTAGELTIEPEFYETVRFKIAVGLLILLLALVLHRRRVDKLHRHQEALRRSEEHFRSLIENGSDMIFVVERDGTLSYASPSAARTLGITAAEVTGKAVTDLLADSDAAVRFLAEVRYQGRFSATLPFRDAEGLQRDVECIGVTHAQDGQIILNCRDITERRKLEAQLEQANRLSSLGRLAATVSHEFNNVLMGIQPFVEILKRKSTDRMVHRATDQMTQSITRGKRISEEILRFTRPIEPTLQPVPLRQWLQDLETEIRAHVGPNVRMGIVAPEGLTIDGDTSQLSQVITNLAINARDAGAAVIRIEARPVDGNGVFPFGIVREPEGMAHITFSDDGSGIPDSVLPNIFEPLFTTKTTKGTGLGLAVAQQVIS
ncbi:MAG TPA: two-component regulator propeller domain-containing protein, partial [Thermoanaerobaculia bacterium]|nr:two-component regulator propeller domain-containing protein [Thermoanaerobaculia bacterium]